MSVHLTKTKTCAEHDGLLTCCSVVQSTVAVSTRKCSPPHDSHSAPRREALALAGHHLQRFPSLASGDHNNISSSHDQVNDALRTASLIKKQPSRRVGPKAKAIAACRRTSQRSTGGETSAPGRTAAPDRRYRLDGTAHITRGRRPPTRSDSKDVFSKALG